MLSKYEDRAYQRLNQNAKIVLKYFFKYKINPFELAKINGIPEEKVVSILNDQELIKEIISKFKIF